VKQGAVIGAGTILTASLPVYDIVRKKIYRATGGSPLVIPEGAVVVPGARPLQGAFAREHGLALYAPLIVKYRDEKTDTATALEGALR
jgi:2,3,4,5-tetrahydropyridine-2-carboxylate N-succinyltransferase